MSLGFCSCVIYLLYYIYLLPFFHHGAQGCVHRAPRPSSIQPCPASLWHGGAYRPRPGIHPLIGPALRTCFTYQCKNIPHWVPEAAMMTSCLLNDAVALPSWLPSFVLENILLLLIRGMCISAGHFVNRFKDCIQLIHADVKWARTAVSADSLCSNEVCDILRYCPPKGCFFKELKKSPDGSD